jgi:hypothetical protein
LGAGGVGAARIMAAGRVHSPVPGSLPETGEIVVIAKHASTWQVVIHEHGPQDADVAVARHNGSEREIDRLHTVRAPSWWRKRRGRTFSQDLIAAITEAQSRAIALNTRTSEVRAVVEAMRDIERGSPCPVIAPMKTKGAGNEAHFDPTPQNDDEKVALGLIEDTKARKIAWNKTSGCRLGHSTCWRGLRFSLLQNGVRESPIYLRLSSGSEKLLEVRQELLRDLGEAVIAQADALLHEAAAKEPIG